MKNLKRIFSVFLILVCLFTCSLSVSAADYQDSANDATTYWTTSDSNKEMVYSRPMYDTQKLVTATDLGVKPFEKLVDIHAEGGKIYLLDNNGRLLIFDEQFKLLKEISTIKNDKEDLTFVGAEGIYADKNGNIYICDTTNERLLILDKDYNLTTILTVPQDELWPADLHYKPTRAVIDNMGYLYVLSKGSFYGAAMYTPELQFKGFYGANVTTTSVLAAVNNLWDVLFTNAEKLSRSAKSLPFSFVDMVLGADGYVYTCTSADTFNSKGAVRRLNPNGTNILIDKSGQSATNSSDALFGTSDRVKRDGKGVSHSISAITVDENNYMYVLDSAYGRVYVYDIECNLITTIGGGVQGYVTEQEGTFRSATAITTMNGITYVVDSTKGGVVSFKINDYGKLVQEAQTLTLNGDYADAQPLWEEVMAQDRNCILAYRGLAKHYLLKEDYNKAMEYSKLGFDRLTYSQAYEYVRQDFLSRNFTWIFVGIIVLCVALVVFLKIKKKRNIVLIKNKKLKIALGTLTHPADTFYEIKRNNNGSVIIATALLLVWYVFKIIGLNTGFIFNDTNIKDVNAWYYLAQTLGLVILFVVSNWLVCVLFEGKGKLKHIYIATCYSIIPLIIQSIAYDILSNVLTLDESSFITILNYVCILLTAVYLVMALINIQEFTFGKFFLTTIVTVLAMILVIFLLFLLFILLQQSVEFIKTVSTELLYR